MEKANRCAACAGPATPDADRERQIEHKSEAGRYALNVHPVFPGIQLIYFDAHIQSASPEKRGELSGDILEITHCREGRLECSVDGAFWYLAAGDLAIVQANRLSSSFYFPLRHYHGVTVRIDLSRAPGCLSCLLEDVTVHPRALYERYCAGGGAFVARSDPSVAHIFSELYAVPAEIRKGYFKVKVLELLLFLSAPRAMQEDAGSHRLPPAQVRLAKEVSRYLAAHMDDRITLGQLAARFGVSGTQIKNAFRGVYGVSVGAYARARKMESAAYMLEYTDRSILEIAGEHGYDNSSKFAGAFRAVKGMAPSEYRRLNRPREK